MLNGIPDIAAKRAALGPARVAFRDLASGASTSYRDLDDNSARAASVLAGLGVAASERVALLCRNRVEFFELLFACAKLGAVLVPLNWRMPANELEPLLRDAQPALLIYGCEDELPAQELARGGVAHLALDGDDYNAYRALRDAATRYEGRHVWPCEEIWYLLYTSGTTGKPKGVIQTYGMAIANYVNIRQAMSICANDVTLNYLPLFHTAGINLVTLPTLIEGGEVLITKGFDIERTIDLLSRGAVDTFFAVPAVYQQISLHAQFDALDLTGIRSWGCGGAPMPDDLVMRYVQRGARVCNGMGMTETGPTVFLMDEAMVRRKIGSVGKPQVLAAVRIVDKDGRDARDGKAGELWFSGPGVTPGYWRRDDANAEAFSADGWLRSGDLGRRDKDGYYYIVGRIKEMFISGGENVYPAEVENVLAAHPDILEVAVVAMPDDKWGETGRAYVLPRPGHRLPEADELRGWSRKRLAAFKVPKEFIQVDDFPRTAAGKVQKHLLDKSS